MKVIFLDIDGVMNGFARPINPSIEKRVWTPNLMREYGIELEVFPELVERINKIAEDTGAFFVISSSWRIGYLADWADVIIYLHNMGLKGFILGRTPWGEDLRKRGLEIQAWLKQHKDENIESFIILDDDGDMEPFMNRLVQTDHKYGIQDEHVHKAIEMLK